MILRLCYLNTSRHFPLPWRDKSALPELSQHSKGHADCLRAVLQRDAIAVHSAKRDVRVIDANDLIGMDRDGNGAARAVISAGRA